MNVDGSNIRLIAAVSDPNYPSISPDGRTVYFTASRDGASATWRVSIDGGTPEFVTSSLDRVTVSHDGKQLAGIYRTTDGTLFLAVANISDGQITQKFSPLPLTTQGGVVQWARDGKGLFFTGAERSNIWFQSLSGGDAVKVTNFSDQTIF